MLINSTMYVLLSWDQVIQSQHPTKVYFNPTKP
jgi:hypothetical protein